MYAAEMLESRYMLAPLVGDVLKGSPDTMITGSVYDDVNANGVKDGGDNGLPAWRVYIDLDGSGTYNTDAAGAWEPSAITNIDGDFKIGNLIAGTYRVAEVLEAGWTPTSPLSRDVSVGAGKETKTAYFNFGGGSVTGTLWTDLDRDGTRAVDSATGAFTESGLAGWSVFVDVNGSRSLDSGDAVTTTDAYGHYRFDHLASGDYEVYQVLKDGWQPSIGFDTHQTVTIRSLQTTTRDFGNFSDLNGSLRGNIWSDVNLNGVRDTDPATGEWTDPGIAGWTVYVDLDGDGALSAGDPTAVTDKDGQYVFPNLAAGNYVVVEDVPADWNVVDGFAPSWPVSVGAGVTTVAPDFANFTALNGSISGAIWSDRFRDGIRDVDLTGGFLDPGLGGWTVFLDRNRNAAFDAGEPTTTTDPSGGYSFTNLQVGDYDVYEVVPSGWEPTLGYDISQTVTVASGVVVTARDFANFNVTSVVAGIVCGTVWNDVNGNGIRDVDATGTFSDPGVAGRTVFVDVNGNGVQDVGEPNATTAVDGGYSIRGVNPGTVTVVTFLPSGWFPTSPSTGDHAVSVRNAATVTGIDFGTHARQEGVLSGTVFHDADGNGVRTSGEKGLSGLTVYLDLNDNGVLDGGEPQTVTSEDKFFTPAVDEAGTWQFTHLGAGTHVVRVQLPAALTATAVECRFSVTLPATGSRVGLDTAAQYRATEIHGTRYEDANGNGVRDAGEPGVAGTTLYLDLNRDNTWNIGEPTTTSGSDGSYAFVGLSPGAYVVRDVIDLAQIRTFPGTRGGVLWPAGTSNPPVGAVGPGGISASLASGESLRQSVTLTLPASGALTNMVDVFLLFDDTGSFTWNSPIVRGAFPTIIDTLNATLPGVDLGFGVGRFEEYANYAWEYANGRPFILNQPIVAANTPGYMASIQAALNRTTPGYGGDAPETDFEALYQLATGVGFDGNNNGSVLDSGAAGLFSTQVDPGGSGDVPSFASYVADGSDGGLPAAGNVGGGGFRSGALPIVLLATDVGFAYQPKGETVVNGAGGVSVPVSSLTGFARPDTPFNAGAGLQETITALNALGGLVIGLGTNPEPNLDPRQGLEAISKLTGAINRSATTIDNGTATPIAPGDPLYFEIASGFASSVASGVVNAIQNAATQVAMDVSVRASDPRVRIVNHTGIVPAVGAGQTATFDIEFVGDGIPHRFDLQFVRNGSGVVMGSIPVVLGTPVPGDAYAFEDCLPGEIHGGVDFGVQGPPGLANHAPSDITLTGDTLAENLAAGTIIGRLATTDPDTGDSFTYSLVGGDAGAFAISGDQLLSAVSFDYESRSSYSIRLRSTDRSGLSTEKLFSIAVSDVLDTPTTWRSGGMLTAVSSTYGVASATTATTLAGAFLAGNVTATAPAGFEVSSDAVVYGPSATFSVTAGAFSGTLWVRLAATASAGTYAGDVTISGGGAADVMIAVPSSTVATRPLAVAGLTAAGKTYDGTTTVLVAGGTLGPVQGVTASGVISSDLPQVVLDRTSIIGTTPDKNVGSSKPVTVGGLGLAGAKALNYVITWTNTPTAAITRAMLSVVGLGVNDKPYDGTTSATFQLAGASFGGVCGADDITPSSAVGAFASASAGTGIAVTATVSASGVDAPNYTISTASLKGTIVPKLLTIAGLTAASRVYDGSTNATVGGTAKYVGLATVDATKFATPMLVGTRAAAFADGNAGVAKTVSISGYVAPSSNYALGPVTTMATISPKALAISGLTGVSRAYDGTTGATVGGAAKYVGLAAADATKFAVPTIAGIRTAAFGDKNVGVAKPVVVTGYVAPSTNYTLAPLTLAANITRKVLTVTGASATSRVYDGSVVVQVNGGAFVAGGVIGSDVVSLDGSAVRGALADKKAGASRSVTVTGYVLAGADIGNYSVAQPTGLKATILPKTVAVVGLTGADKTYDATAVASVTGTAALNPTRLVAGDVVTLGGVAKFIFASVGVGTAKPITATGFTISGADAANYALVQPTGLTANVTPATITVAGPHIMLTQDVAGKVVIPALTATVTGLKGADTATAVYSGVVALTTTATATSPKGTYVVTVKQGSLALKTANYRFTFIDGSIDVQ